MTLTRMSLLFALAACKPTPPEAAADPQALAAPFGVDELRAGLPAGTTVLYRLSTPDGLVMYSLYEVVEADAQGLKVHSTQVDEGRAPLGPAATMERTWEAMLAESQPKEGDEVLPPERQDTALGKLRVTTIIVNNPDNEDMFDIRAYSSDHPGLVIKQESIMNGQRVLMVEAIEWTVGPPQ